MGLENRVKNVIDGNFEAEPCPDWIKRKLCDVSTPSFKKIEDNFQKDIAQAFGLSQDELFQITPGSIDSNTRGPSILSEWVTDNADPVRDLLECANIIRKQGWSPEYRLTHRQLTPEKIKDLYEISMEQYIDKHITPNLNKEKYKMKREETRDYQTITIDAPGYDKTDLTVYAYVSADERRQGVEIYFCKERKELFVINDDYDAKQATVRVENGQIIIKAPIIEGVYTKLEVE